MIIKGSQRGHGAQLAAHLLNPVENDHVTVHGIDGLLAADLKSAFLEIEAIAKGTKCQQPFFSVSVNPPADADITDKQFRDAVHRIERINGLRGQPRAMVFHEKDGRRHLHVVWSRIDARTMTAKNLSHFKTKLMTISKELFLEHGFDLPDGFKEDGQASPDRVGLAEWQAAKRRGKNALDQKRLIRQCWERSDSRAGFEAAQLQNQTRGGLAGFWDRVTGARAEIERAIIITAAKLDALNAEDLHKQRKRQLRERRVLEQQRTKLRQEAFGLVDDLRHEHDDLIARMTGASPRTKPKLSDRFQDAHHIDPRQPFVAQETSGPVTDTEIRQYPMRVLERLSYFDETFSATDIHRALARVIASRQVLAVAREQVLAAPALLPVETDSLPRYTTHTFRNALPLPHA